MKKLSGLLLCAVLMGCAHGKMGVIDQGLEKGAIGSGHTIYVEPVLADKAVFSGDKAGEQARLDEEKSLIKERLNRLIADELCKHGFKAVPVTERAKSGLALTGQVTRFEHGSAAARIMVGMGAGSSNLYTNFQLTDLKTKKVLSKFEVIATSGGNGGFQAAGGYVQAHLIDCAEKTAEYVASSNGNKK